jgi:hypothetical protein
VASSSTNKQPLLIDRPLLVVESLAATHAPVGALDVNTGVVAALLVDCTQNDGALLSDIAAINRVANQACEIGFYLSRSALTLGTGAASGGFGGIGLGKHRCCWRGCWVRCRTQAAPEGRANHRSTGACRSPRAGRCGQR